MNQINLVEKIRARNLFGFVDVIFLLFILVVSVVGLLSLGRDKGDFAEIYRDNQLIMTVSLDRDGEYRIENGKEYNIVVVYEGSIFVRESSCHNQSCVRCGKIRYGKAQIICIPNGLRIYVVSDKQNIDAET